MTTITLLPHAEKLAPAHTIPGYQDNGSLLYHQVRTYEALECAPLVMNTYPTGTGKTIAALLRLLHPDQRGHNTLIIAPTNALIDQHTADVAAFIQRHQLALRAFPMHAATIRALLPDVRRGEVTHRFLENYMTFADVFGLPDDAEKLPFVVVTNPDIFYLALYFRYGRNDQRNLFADFITRFRYVVIDEFHYYDTKQFANFLFFFALWEEWGYFDEKRSICLLSATPRQQVSTYFNQLFGADRWRLVSPDNEPPESASYETRPTLTELHLTVATDPLVDWVEAHRTTIEAWQTDGLDSAIISSSLGQINEVRHMLRHLDPVRITGPEPPAERQRVRPLILATPTVDIGYNFGRPGKQRQSIDRLVCDARFGDELTQRIGRAGRVLGRAETTTPSEAVVLVSEEAASDLRAYDGQRLSRHEWAAAVAQFTALPPNKHRLEGYIRSQAIVESFYPVYHLHKLAHPDENLLERLFQMLRSVFDPTSKQRVWSLRQFFQTYERRRQWLRLPEVKRWAADEQNLKHVAQHFAAYVSWRESSTGKTVQYKGEQVRPHLKKLLLQQPQQQRNMLTFIASQVAVTDALFNFREAWQGPQAAVYDAQHLLSSETINQYDVLHLVANYTLHLFPDRASFERACGPTDPASLYVSLTGFLSPKLTIGFAYDSKWSRGDFEQRLCRSVVALHGLHLIARERGTQVSTTTTLDVRIREAVETDWIPCLIVPEGSVGALLGTLRGTPFYASDLKVIFETGDEVWYKIITGTAALHVQPELKRHFAMQDKQLGDDAIFL